MPEYSISVKMVVKGQYVWVKMASTVGSDGGCMNGLGGDATDTRDSPAVKCILAEGFSASTDSWSRRRK